MRQIELEKTTPIPFPLPTIRLTPFVPVQRFFESSVENHPDRLCVISNGIPYTYGDLERDANRLANYLISRNHVAPGDRVGILLTPSYDSYVAMLAVLKANATFVPIDLSFPPDRIQFIAEDAQIRVVLTESALRHLTCGLGSLGVLEMDGQYEALECESATRPVVAPDPNRLCYIIYTSGTTGKPKGVAVSQGNFCNFLQVIPAIYGVQPEDRVYQGMTIAFDFSFEEIWPTFIAGATLITGPRNVAERIGPGLASFLSQHRITLLYCVPTLLATIDEDIPSLRTIYVGGEACPRDLVARWAKPGRRILNTYGPTEATISASWTELYPGAPVTIGKPIPTYRVDVRNEQLQLVSPGEIGEICIAGPGVAQGYINRPEQTGQRFVRDPDNPDGRMYRTGDMGRIASDGDVEYLGRMDTQVKIRGYRIELSEIENVLLEDAEVVNALVNPWQGARHDDVVELVAYLIPREGAATDQRRSDALYQRLRAKLPAYMVPAYIEWVESFPTLASGKADRSRLPTPASARLVVPMEATEHPADECELQIAEAWREVFGVEAVPANANFFNDLGGHSLFAARVVSRLRNIPAFAKLSVRALYDHPTIRQLASFVSAELGAPQHGKRESASRLVRFAVSNKRVWLAGITQSIALFALFALTAAPFVVFDRLMAPVTTLPAFLLKAVIGINLLLAISLIMPLAIKWLVIGRFRPGRYRLWGAYFLRWWLVQKALQMAPWYLLSGSPLINAYLRLLGCEIGRDCHIGTTRPIMPDLVSMGSGVSIGYNVDLTPHEISAGWLLLAPIHLGDRAYVGNGSVVCHGVRVMPGGQLGEQSMAPPNLTISEDTYWDGSPARMQSTRPPALVHTGTQRAPRSPWKVGLWTICCIGAVPLLSMLPWIATIPAFALLIAALQRYGIAGLLFALLPAGAIYTVGNCILIASAKLLVGHELRAGTNAIYSLQGLRKWVVDRLIAISLMVNNSLYATLYTPIWLRALGVRIGRGSEVSTLAFFDPNLLSLGDGCFIADMASLGPATFHNGWFVTRPTAIGERAFVGNGALVPSGGAMGDNTLLGVSSRPNTDRVEAGTSWLGVPAMFLPRRQLVEGFGEALTFSPPVHLVALRLFVEFFRVVLPATLTFGGLLALYFAFRQFTQGTGIGLAILLASLLAMCVAIGLALVVVALKWIIVGRYTPKIKPMWSHFVWRSELITGLYESVAAPLLLGSLAGTPMFAPFLRLFGSRIGKRVYCDTTYVTEFDLVQVADDVSIGRDVSLQTHLFEDRVMKMSNVKIDSCADIGIRSVVLYNSHIRTHARVGAFSLILKGEEILPNSNWEGIPAQRVEEG